ncbi:polysaccharide deacetylase family protein [Amycolatopsis saalfeldensis]|uniref:Polysaccharide deacetylase n=1 Tax=Amycolatopsis saalfeldensis TaxID=394193 RepID=A0A1H8XP16_9PSEU|nr:polysaccharide deacetylase family protein [Amycolatopsis saalfeldensis]SEP41854.1 Polysaccharide deacetylase [Amycolatopsis saalfeldensis]
MVNFAVHGVGRPERALDPGEDERWITVEQFDRLLEAVAGQEDAHLTFDDGNASDVEVALPRLVSRGLRAEFFPLAGRVGERGYVDPDGLRQLVDAGMDVGSHGWERRDWRRLDDRQARRELEAAPRLLTELSGRAVCRYSLPSGRLDRRVLGRLRAAGATRVYSSSRSLGAGPGGWLQPRVQVHREMDADWVAAALGAGAGFRRPRAGWWRG